MSAGVRSHHEPERGLSQHVLEVIAAGRALLAQHGPAPLRAVVDGLVEDMARLHDLGKGSAAFQRYIADPDAYTGDPNDKARAVRPHGPWCELVTGIDSRRRA